MAKEPALQDCSVTEESSIREQAPATQKPVMASAVAEKATTTGERITAEKSPAPILRELKTTARLYSSWNVKSSASFRSREWVQIRTGVQGELKRDMIPRTALIKRAPGLHKYLDGENGHIVLPDGAVQDDALDTVIDAIIACAKSKQLEMVLPEDPLKLIHIHCVLVLFGMKDEASIVKERLWTAMGRYELETLQIREIWFNFSDGDDGMESQYVAPDAAEYIQMMAWQLVNLEVEKKLSDLVLTYIINTPALEQALLERHSKYGIASGYKPTPAKSDLERYKEESVRPSPFAAVRLSSSSRNMAPRSKAPFYGNKPSGEGLRTESRDSLGKAEQIEVPANEQQRPPTEPVAPAATENTAASPDCSLFVTSKDPPAASALSFAKTVGKRARSQARSDSEDERDDKKVKTGIESSAQVNHGNFRSSIFGQPSTPQQGSPPLSTPKKKSTAGRKIAGSSMLRKRQASEEPESPAPKKSNPFGGILTSATPKRPGTSSLSSTPTAKPNPFGSIALTTKNNSSSASKHGVLPGLSTPGGKPSALSLSSAATPNPRAFGVSSESTIKSGTLSLPSAPTSQFNPFDGPSTPSAPGKASAIQSTPTSTTVGSIFNTAANKPATPATDGGATFKFATSTTTPTAGTGIGGASFNNIASSTIGGGAMFKFPTNAPATTGAMGSVGAKGNTSPTRAGSNPFEPPSSAPATPMGGNVFQSNLFTPPAGGNMFRAQNTPATPAGGNMFKFQSTRATPAGGNMFGAQNALDHFNHPPNPPALQQMPPSFGGGQASTAPVGNFGTPFSGAPDPFSGLSAPAQTPLQIASAPSWNFNAQNTSTPAPGSDGSLFTFGGNSGNSGNTSGNTLLAAPPGGARRILKPKGRMGRGR